MRYPHGCSSGCTPELCCSWTSQDCALRSASGLPGRQYSCGWTPQLGAPGRRTFPAVCRSIATGSVLPHWVAHLRPPSGVRSLDGFSPFISSSRAPSFSKVRTPGFPLRKSKQAPLNEVEGFPPARFVALLPIHLPVFASQVRKASTLSIQQFWEARQA
jgi:hypothetical protein